MFGIGKWGIHPDYQKDATSGKSIETPPPPAKVAIPTRQHIGAPCSQVVKKGDIVKKGQLIAAGSSPVSSNIHASVSGKVVDVAVLPHPVYGTCEAIVIENDGQELWADGIPLQRDWTALQPSEILEIVKAAGVVGMGGAAFPSYVKLAPPPGKRVDTLVINAAECEPFLTVDHRLMLEKPSEIAQGIKIIQKLLGVTDVVMGIEDNKMDAVKSMAEALKGCAKVVPIPTKYPQGAEKMLIKTLLGREVPTGKLPLDVGVVVQNVSTALAIFEAVAMGIPTIERVVTISGGAVKEPKNLRLRIGISFEDAINLCGGLACAPEKLIMGGPMMGASQYTLGVPVIKGTSGILVLSKEDVHNGEESACIRCGRCVKNCPMGLNPSMLGILGERELFEEAKDEYGLLDCLECGCCSYNCPSKRKIVHYVKYAKRLAAEKAAADKAAAAKNANARS